MNLMEHVYSIRETNARYREIVRLGNVGHPAPFNMLSREERLERGARIADLWEQVAWDCEGSAAVRATFPRWTPQMMRDEAAQWREGVDPRWEIG